MDVGTLPQIGAQPGGQIPAKRAVQRGMCRAPCRQRLVQPGHAIGRDLDQTTTAVGLIRHNTHKAATLQRL